ncbi:hypothetical protein P8605_47255 [Streptomyces sp. T-3]|nr:hypothetical protein [Streptomyces sp. T-3]
MEIQISGADDNESAELASSLHTWLEGWPDRAWTVEPPQGSQLSVRATEARAVVAAVEAWQETQHGEVTVAYAVVMEASASDNARIYQAGRDLHITDAATPPGPVLNPGDDWPEDGN